MGALTLANQTLSYREWFEDIRCDESELAPRHLQTYLTALGGKTIYGKPLFRVARCETIWRKTAIDFPIWRDTDDPNNVIPIREAVDMMNAGLARIARMEDEAEKQKQYATLCRATHDFVVETAESNERALRRDTGYRWVNKYPTRGIVIEKWNPPDMYGNPAEWEAKKILGFSFCGPYPSEGDYEIIGFEEEEEEQLSIVNLVGVPMTVERKTRIPWFSRDRVLRYVQDYHRLLHTQPENVHTRTMLRIAEHEQRELRRYQRLQKHFDPLVKDLKQIMNSMSLEAQRLRDQMVKECRLLNHGKGMGHVG